MNKTLLCLLSAAACAVSAHAATYVDFDHIVTYLSENGQSSYSSNFNIATDNDGADTYGNIYGDHGPQSFRNLAGSTLGYVANPLCTITSAVMTFGVWSGDCDVEVYGVKLGSSSSWLTPSKSASYDGGYDVYSLTLDSVALTDLGDGILNYCIGLADTGVYTRRFLWWTYTEDRVYDDAWLKWAKLTVTTECTPPQQVPDGGATAALLGLSLLGLAAVRRRTA